MPPVHRLTGREGPQRSAAPHGRNATFKEFARATLAAAAKRYGKGPEHEVALEAWAEVGVNGNGNG